MMLCASIWSAIGWFELRFTIVGTARELCSASVPSFKTCRQRRMPKPPRSFLGEATATPRKTGLREVSVRVGVIQRRTLSAAARASHLVPSRAFLDCVNALGLISGGGAGGGGAPELGCN